MCTPVTDGPDFVLTTMALTMAPAVLASATGVLMLLFLVIVSLIAGPENVTPELAAR